MVVSADLDPDVFAGQGSAYILICEMQGKQALRWHV